MVNPVPVCLDGMTWWEVTRAAAVGWIAAGGPPDGYRLKPLRSSVTTSWPCQTDYDSRLALGERVVGVGGRAQWVHTLHAAAGAQAPQVASLTPLTAVRIVEGPECADGQVWWHIRGPNGSLDGWSSEGDQTQYWLFEVDQLRPVEVAPAAGSLAVLAGSYSQDDTSVAVAASFIADTAEVWFPSGFAAALGFPPIPPDSARLGLTIPIEHTRQRTDVRITIALANVYCDSGSDASLRLDAGGSYAVFTCQRNHNSSVADTLVY